MLSVYAIIFPPQSTCVYIQTCYYAANVILGLVSYSGFYILKSTPFHDSSCGQPDKHDVFLCAFFYVYSEGNDSSRSFVTYMQAFFFLKKEKKDK